MTTERVQKGPPGNFKMLDVTDATFERDVLKSGRLTYVLFYSETCKSCVDMQATINQIGIAFMSQLNFVRVNVASNQSYAAKYSTGGGMPLSVILNKEGEVVRDTRIQDGQSIWTGDASNLQYFINWLNTVINVAGEQSW
jgi:thioredoxin-like negative regulator of GroEL